MVKLLEAREGPELEPVERHIDALEHVIKLTRSLRCIPAAGELREVRADLLKRDAIAVSMATPK